MSNDCPHFILNLKQVFEIYEDRSSGSLLLDEAPLVEVVEVDNPAKVVLPDQLRVHLLLVQQRDPKYRHLVPDRFLIEVLIDFEKIHFRVIHLEYT